MTDSPSTLPTTPVRASACPGLLRIVPTRDGGLCRIKLPCGQLTAMQARAIAAAAERHASGVIELTNRANLQLRGVRDPSMSSNGADTLIVALLDAGLGPRTPGGDDVRNLLVSPSFGIDADMLCDVTALASQIIESLQTTTRFHELSPKFAVLLDGGERSATREHPHDLWLSAQPDGRYAFGLAGCPGDGGALGIVPAESAAALVEAVLHVFLDYANPSQTRMRDLLADLSTAIFLRRVQRHLSVPIDIAENGWRRIPGPAYAHIGIHPQRQSGLSYVGAAAAVGRVDAAQLRTLADIAETHGDASLRVTPQQGVLLPNIPNDAAQSVVQALVSIGFVVDPREPLARLIACAGSAGCAKGRADTKADALRIADRLGNSGALASVHLSGCERSCAAAHTAAFTLLASSPDRYTLYRRVADTASFGDVIASDIDIAQAATLLMQHSPIH